MKAILQPAESAIAGARRIFLAHISAAIDAWPPGKKDLSDAAVHEARKAIKRARAILRLMRFAIGDEFYKQENTLLRDAARPLTQMRDASVLMQALQDLLTHSGKAATSIPTRKFKERLSMQRQQAAKSALGGSKQLAAARASLLGAAERTKRWPWLADDWEALDPAIRRTYKAGRKALTVALEQRSDEALHEWRKQTKYLWHQLQILLPMRPGMIGKLAEEAHRLADALGDDHDLAVLRSEILSSGSALETPAAMDALVELLDARRAGLQGDAREIGRVLYAKKPSAFQKRLEKRWHEWRDASGRG